MGNDQMLLWLEARDLLKHRLHAQKREKVLHMLRYAGFVEDTGERERSYKTGETQSVWRLTERGKTEWASVSERPDDFEACLAEVIADFEKSTILER
jgi:hypothetical protein